MLAECLSRQIRLLSRQKYACRVFVATNTSFVETKVCLPSVCRDKYVFCRDKSMLAECLSRQIRLLSRQKYACRVFVATNTSFVETKVCLPSVCRDKSKLVLVFSREKSFVATHDKHVFVAREKK